MTQDLRAGLVAELQPLYSALPGGKGVGSDPLNDLPFQLIVEQIGLIDRGINPRWEIVTENAIHLLNVSNDQPVLGNAPPTRDFRVAVWYMYGQWKRFTWEGLARGLVLLIELSRRYWSTMSPRAEKRDNFLQWWKKPGVALHSEVEAASVSQKDKAWLPIIRDLASELQDELRQKVTSDAIELLVAAVRGQIKEEIDDPVSAVPSPEGAPEGTPDETPDGATAPAPPSAASSARSLSESGATIIQAARRLRQQDISNPEAYRLMRVGLYLEWDSGPSSVEDGSTTLPAPPEALRKSFDKLIGQQDWRGLVTQAEDTLKRHPFWLDLHRLSYLGLDRLGGRCDLARDAVGQSIVHLAWRLPELPKLRFAGDVAFADRDTRNWIEVEQWRHAWGSSPASLPEVAEERRMIEHAAEAQSLVRGGRSADALQLMTSAGLRAQDARSRIRSRLAMVRVALLGKHTDIAQRILEDLRPVVDQAYKVAEWDPRLFGDVLCAWLDVLPVSANDRATHLNALMKVDPGAAVKYLLTSTGKSA